MPNEESVSPESGLVPLADLDFDTLADFLKPLGNATRLRLLHFLTKPRYMEEVASRLKMSRQGARKHLEGLTKTGLLRTQLGRRDFGPVTEYVLDRARVYQVHAEFARLGALRPPTSDALQAATIEAGGAEAGTRRATSSPRLLLVQGLDSGSVFPLHGLEGTTWSIGRGGNVDVQISYDPFASARHAEVRRTSRGFSVVDAYSTNGTYVNYARLARGSERALDYGDVIGVGRSLFVLQGLDAAPR